MTDQNQEVTDITNVIRRVFKLKDHLLKLRASFSDSLDQDNRSVEEQEFLRKWNQLKASQNS
jgi:hypothetical protein